MKRVAYHPQARLELFEISGDYDQHRRRLGDRFLSRLESMIKGIEANPGSGTPGVAGTRRRRVQTFPYMVIYKEYADHILIYALAHIRRRPNYWLSRIPGQTSS